jgi:hypothetical protein
MRKVFSGIALAVLSFAFVVLTAGSSNAAVAVNTLTIGEFGYNARGADSWFNRNKEYVALRNTSAGTIDLNGLVVTDNWGKAKFDDSPTCNTFKVTASRDLPANGVIRIYVGYGVAVTTGANQTAFMNSRCGYKGHIFNNLSDNVWVLHGGEWKSKGYDFDNGYYVS